MKFDQCFKILKQTGRSLQLVWFDMMKAVKCKRDYGMKLKGIKITENPRQAPQQGDANSMCLNIGHEG
jgi:hypothetical protein